MTARQSACFHRAKAQISRQGEITSVMCAFGDFIGQPAATAACTWVRSTFTSWQACQKPLVTFGAPENLISTPTFCCRYQPQRKAPRLRPCDKSRLSAHLGQHANLLDHQHVPRINGQRMPDQSVHIRSIEQRTQQAAIAHIHLERFDEPLADIDEMRLEPAQHPGVQPVDRDSARRGV